MRTGPLQEKMTVTIPYFLKNYSAGMNTDSPARFSNLRAAASLVRARSTPLRPGCPPAPTRAATEQGFPTGARGPRPVSLRLQAGVRRGRALRGVFTRFSLSQPHGTGKPHPSALQTLRSYRLKACGSSALTKSIGTSSPQHLLHFTSPVSHSGKSCNISNFFTIRSVIGDVISAKGS